MVATPRYNAFSTFLAIGGFQDAGRRSRTYACLSNLTSQRGHNLLIKHKGPPFGEPLIYWYYEKHALLVYSGSIPDYSP